MIRITPAILALLVLPTMLAAQNPKPFEVTGATIAETQAAIREGRTTCRAIVEGYLARIKAYDQTLLGPDHLPLNAIVLINPNALAEADACDRNFAATHKLPPLGGIAMLIKDNYDTAGLQTTGGSLAMKGSFPSMTLRWSPNCVPREQSCWPRPTWRSGRSARI